MRITKKEAERIFNNGGTVYGYSKLATNEFDYLDNSFYMLKPMPMRKYAPDVTWKDQLALAKMTGQADWFATHYKDQSHAYNQKCNIYKMSRFCLAAITNKL